MSDPTDLKVADAPPPQRLNYHPPPRDRSSPAGAASFGLGLAALCMNSLMLLGQQNQGGGPPSVGFVSALLGAIFGLPALGLILGVVSLRAPGRRRGLAVAGVILNGLLLVLLAAVVALSALRR